MINNVLWDTKDRIIFALTDVVRALGGLSDIQAIANSYKETMEDHEVLEQLRDWLKGACYVWDAMDSLKYSDSGRIAEVRHVTCDPESPRPSDRA